MEKADIVSQVLLREAGVLGMHLAPKGMHPFHVPSLRRIASGVTRKRPKQQILICLHVPPSLGRGNSLIISPKRIVVLNFATNI